jgi:proteasome assembly chaperone (PAC2) family protein
MDLENSPELINPVLLYAFEGWNDAGESASTAIDQLIDSWQADLIRTIDPELFYDFQVNRPHISTREDGVREIEWPDTRVYVARIPLANRDVVLLRGIEPNVRWNTFCQEVISIMQLLKIELAIGIGSLLSDTPHTRPIPITTTTNHPEFPETLNFLPSTYEGPTGILGVIGEALSQNGIANGSMWAQVPHYAAGAACPKATLALLSRIEEVLDIAVDLDDLTEAAAEWESDVNSMMEDDEELSTYVTQLEATADKEFERYLRRRNTN